MNFIKKYVSIIAIFESDGKVIPQTIIWDDGRKFDIDYVIDIRKRASLKAGGVGIRYICRIKNKEIYLYKDDDLWFMEIEENRLNSV